MLIKKMKSEEITSQKKIKSSEELKNTPAEDNIETLRYIAPLINEYAHPGIASSDRNTQNQFDISIYLNKIADAAQSVPESVKEKINKVQIISDRQKHSTISDDEVNEMYNNLLAIGEEVAKDPDAQLIMQDFIKFLKS
jgi:hypothetical protein